MREAGALQAVELPLGLVGTARAGASTEVVSGGGVSGLDRFTLPNLEQEPAADQHGSTPDQEADVPEDPLLPRHGLVDMVDAEQVMIDDAFDQVEQTEADQERAGEQLGRPSYVPATGRPP